MSVKKILFHLKNFSIVCLLLLGADLMETFIWNSELGVFTFTGGFIYGQYRAEKD
jgi:hypothetical protein